jgi:regulator of protease activity HflC (stomatin/prohibitin superfamily)
MMMGPFYVVNEGSQVVVTRFGKIVNTHTDAGLYFKVPFVDVVVTYPKLILSQAMGKLYGITLMEWMDLHHQHFKSEMQVPYLKLLIS